ncbi:MAG: type II secretion system minor pseudopilin GspI [Proteobacteria bacterium]|nr:type II secretion system minor pseudopilin GspI [Pseudomonadota bacterium]
MRRAASGFTLIEVLVALAIAAIGLAAVLAVVTNTSRDAVYLRDRMLASWIGQNKLTELRLQATLPSVDKTSGELDYAGRKWKWQQAVTQTEVPGMRRIDVAVRFAESDEKDTVATVTGFVGRVQISAPARPTTWDLPLPTGGGGTNPSGGLTTTVPATGSSST